MWYTNLVLTLIAVFLYGMLDELNQLRKIQAERMDIDRQRRNVGK
jgi:hypothetical protein